MRYLVTFTGEVEGQEAVTHGGVTFPIGKAVELNSDEVALSPWFEGNPSFSVEALPNETSKAESQHDDPFANRSAGGGSKASAEVDQVKADELKPVVKRSRRKAATK